MSEDVAAVLARRACKGSCSDFHRIHGACISHIRQAQSQLDALTAAGYAVVVVPEGVTVNHGARLVSMHPKLASNLFAIETTP